jgi:two-component system chemotaxis sensor kinase CheA
MSSSKEKKMFDLLLDEIEDTLIDIEQRCLKFDSSDRTRELLIVFRAAHNVKGAAQLYGLIEFGSFVHAFEDVLTALQKNTGPVSSQSLDVLLTAQGFLRNWVQGLRNDHNFKPDTTTARQGLKKHVEELNSALSVRPEMATIVEHPTPVNMAPAPPVAAEAVLDVQQDVQQDVQTPSPNRESKKRASHSLRISSTVIDEIMQIIGELSIHQGILWHNLQNHTLNVLTSKDAVSQNQKTLRNLYDLVLTLRMQPAETLYQRMERTARDVAREQKKSVALKFHGAETPLDKTVIELITDPMMHIVRNAIDHGLEDDEERRSAGKPVPARLSIQTVQDANQILLSISDDGRGMDPQLIYEKALKKGLIPAGKRLKEKEIIELLFMPGFSTRDQVTHISGRGVGLDIVRKAIQELGGTIEILSTKGLGSTFNIRLPASLEIIDGLVVRVTNQILIVPRREVEEIVDLKGLPMEAVGHGSRAFRMRKHLVPIEELADYLGLSPEQRAMPRLSSSFKSKAFDLQREISLVVALPDRTKVALRVDEILAQQQIVVRPIDEKFSNFPGFGGMTILGNGEPAMIVSTSAIGELFMRWTNRKSSTTRDKDSA